MRTPAKLLAMALAGTAFLASAPDAAGSSKSVARNVIGGMISGSETVSYVLGLGEGQHLEIELTASHPALYFDLTAPDEEEPVHIGAIAGNLYETDFTGAGDWDLTVYFAPHAARRDASARFSLAITVSDQPIGGD